LIRPHCQHHQENHQRQDPVRAVAYWLHRPVRRSPSDFPCPIELRFYFHIDSPRRHWCCQLKANVSVDIGIEYRDDNNFASRCSGRFSGQTARHASDLVVPPFLQRHRHPSILSYSFHAIPHPAGKVPRQRDSQVPLVRYCLPARHVLRPACHRTRPFTGRDDRPLLRRPSDHHRVHRNRRYQDHSKEATSLAAVCFAELEMVACLLPLLGALRPPVF